MADIWAEVRGSFADFFQNLVVRISAQQLIATLCFYSLQGALFQHDNNLGVWVLPAGHLRGCWSFGISHSDVTCLQKKYNQSGMEKMTSTQCQQSEQNVNCLGPCCIHSVVFHLFQGTEKTSKLAFFFSLIPNNSPLFLPLWPARFVAPKLVRPFLVLHP